MDPKQPLEPDYRHVSDPKVGVWHPSEYPFDDWTISLSDWTATFDWLVVYRPSLVVEFGSGLSSLLMSQVVPVISFEHNDYYYLKTKGHIRPYHQLDLRKWDGHAIDSLIPEPRVPVVFIDGPEPDRTPAFMFANERADRVWVHDGFRDAEMRLQLRWMGPDFHLKYIVTSDSRRLMNIWYRCGTTDTVATP